MDQEQTPRIRKYVHCDVVQDVNFTPNPLSGIHVGFMARRASEYGIVTPLNPEPCLATKPHTGPGLLCQL